MIEYDAEDTPEPQRPHERAKVFCGRCNARIFGHVHICCEIMLHGACFANHRRRDHA